MTSEKIFFKGVFPPIVTPFKQNGDIELEGFIKNIEKWNEAPLAGLLVNGSNSEAAFLDNQEKLQLVRLAKKYMLPERYLVAGTGCESLRTTIDFTKACADAGAHTALVLTPSFYDEMMSSQVLIEFFTQVAETSPIPILLYNVPKFTHVNIKADVVRILSQHPNIIGIKDSSGNVPQLASFLREAEQGFQLIVGTASAWYPALALGIQAAILAIANTHPEECALVQQYYVLGEFTKALAIYQALLPVNIALTGTYGVPGLKYASDLRGYTGKYVRSPLMDCTQKEKDEIMHILATAEMELSKILQ